MCVMRDGRRSRFYCGHSRYLLSLVVVYGLRCKLSLLVSNFNLHVKYNACQWGLQALFMVLCRIVKNIQKHCQSIVHFVKCCQS